MSTLGEQIERNRVRLFVGRESHVRQFEALLEHGASSGVLFFHGPGGIGKTSLVASLATRAVSNGWSVVRVDARSAPADPAIVQGLLAQGLAKALGQGKNRSLLVIDTFEEWAALEGWLRDDFLPRLPQNASVVIAGRRPPAARWRSDPGWHGVLQHAELQPLSEAEARDYLERRDVASEDATHIVTAADGQPLLLALMADASNSGSLATSVASPATPDLDASLLTWVDELLPSRGRRLERRALDVVALLKHTTATDIAMALEIDSTRAQEIIDHLAALSFIEADDLGIFPHDRLREVLRGDFARRDPSDRLEILDRVCDHQMDGMWDGHTFDPVIAIEHLYMMQNLMPPIAAVPPEPCFREAAKPDDHVALRAMVERHQDEGGVAIFDLWWEHQPEAFRVVRSAENAVVGFYLLLEASNPGAECLERDPQLAHFHGARSAALGSKHREGHAVLLRMWMEDELHMQPSAVGPLWAVDLVGAMLMDPRTDFGGALTPDNADWRENNRLYGHLHLEDSRELAGEQPIVLSVHDLSNESPMQWLKATYQRLREKLLAGSPGNSAPVDLARGRAPIDREDVRAALRAIHRPDRLATNPLITQLGIEPASQAAVALEKLVREEFEALADNPKTEAIHRVLDVTYFHPVGDQRAAAEAADLSWDQYRRRLTDAIVLMTARIERRLG